MKNSSAVGAWALVCGIVAPVWLIGGFYAAIFTQASTVSPVIQMIAAVALFGWFVVPLAVLGALGLGIAAIVTRRGRPLGVAALVVLALGALSVLALVIAAFGGIGGFLGMMSS